jgi:20S proteasome subunit alpha 4
LPLDNKSNWKLILSYTQRSGVRPFGISVLIAGFNNDKQPQLYLSEPSGALAAWQATAIGRNSDKAIELLEKSWEPEIHYQKGIKIVIETMLNYVEAGSKNLEVAVIFPGEEMTILKDEEVDKIINEIEEKKKEK